MALAEYQRPHTEAELKPEIDWKVFAEYAEKDPAVFLWYELLRPDPTTSGHMEAFEALNAGRMMTDHNPLRSNIYKLKDEDETFREKIYVPILEAAEARLTDELWRDYTQDKYATQTAELSIRILSIIGNERISRQTVNNYWLHYSRAYGQVQTERGQRPNGGQDANDWDHAVMRRTLLNEIWDEDPSMTAEEQKKELMRQVSGLRKKIVVETIDEYFPRGEFRVGLAGVPSEYRQFDHFTKTAPITFEQFKQLELVLDPEPYADPEIRFRDKSGNEVHLAVHAPGTNQWVPFEDFDHGMDLALMSVYHGHRPTDEFYKIKMHRRGQELYLNRIHHLLEQGNHPELISRIQKLLNMPVANWSRGGLVHNVGFHVYSSGDSTYHYSKYDSPYYFEERDRIALQQGKPRLLDQIPPELLVITEYNSESSGDTKGGTTRLPDEEHPSVTSEAEHEQKSRRKVLNVSLKEGIGPNAIRYLDFPMASSLNAEDFMPANLSDNETDAIVTGVRGISADGSYLRIPLPLDSSVTSISISTAETRTVLEHGTDFEIVKNHESGHSVIHFLKTEYQDGIFEYSVGVSLSEPKQAESLNLESDTVHAVGNHFRENEFISVAEVIEDLPDSDTITVAQLEKALKNASLYTYNTRFKYRDFGDSELRRLAGFLDYQGKLHIQCDGAAAVTDEFFKLYNDESDRQDIVCRTGNCISINSGFASEADFHARNHLFIGGKRVAIIDTTPYLRDNSPYGRREAGSPIEIVTPDILKKDVEETPQIENPQETNHQKVSEQLGEVLRLAFPKGIPTNPDASDPIFVVAGCLSSQGDHDMDEAIEKVIQAKSTLNKFLAESLDNRSLMKRYPHYSDPRVSAMVSELLDSAVGVLRSSKA